jgi:DNA-binding transcriptional LysR family regulator
LEIILGNHPTHTPEIEFTPLSDSPLFIVLSASRRWAGRGCVSSEELAKEPCFLPEKSHPTRHFIIGHLATQNIVINGVVHIESLEAIKEMLRPGFGVSMLRAWLVKVEINAGNLAGFPPGRKSLRQPWGLSRLRGPPATGIENSFHVQCALRPRNLCNRRP